MAFGFTPTEYLNMVREPFSEFKIDQLSERRATTCATILNHLPEQIYETYQGDANRLRGATSASGYRAITTGMKSESAIIRGLRDYAKHEPVLSRASVQVGTADQQQAMELDYGAFLMDVPNHVQVYKLIVTLKDGTVRWLSIVLDSALQFWKSEFLSYDF